MAPIETMLQKWHSKKRHLAIMASNLITMTPFLVEYVGIKYLNKILIVSVNNTKVLFFATKLHCFIHFYH